LAKSARTAAALGTIAPLSSLAKARVFLYRGTLDGIYLDGSVNKTRDFFAEFVSDPSSQLKYVANIPSQHAFMTVDPHIPNTTCGVNLPNEPPAMANCGFDGAGETLKHALPSLNIQTPATFDFDPSNLIVFHQSIYFSPTFPSFGKVGYLYVPTQCQDLSVQCNLHIAFHGCGMSITYSDMLMSFVSYTGFNAYADRNDLVILYPQAGGYGESNIQAPTSQLKIDCFDGYGQTGYDYDLITGPQMATVRNMIRAIAGY
jgi:poly(3-hydroxybutyrate) depolymerase